MNDTHFIILMLIVFIGNGIEAIAGFGSVVFALTIGALFYPIPWLITVLVTQNLLLSSYIVIRHRRHINRTELTRKILPFTGVGLVIGIIIFNSVQSETLRVAYGIFVLCFSAYELVRICREKEGSVAPMLSPLKSAMWLISGGMIQGIYASGGPLVVYYAGRTLRDKASFRSTLSSLWLVLNTFIFISLAATGKVTPETLKASGVLLLSVLGGILVGEALHGRFNERMFRIFVYVMLIISGTALLFRK